MIQLQERKTFQNKTKFKQHLSTNSALQKALWKKPFNPKRLTTQKKKHKEHIISDQQIKKVGQGEPRTHTTTK